MTALKRSLVIFLAAGAMTATAAFGQPGPVLTVAPDAAGTRIQNWARAAFSPKADCWLVAWREGDVTEQRSEIWCARVAADGTPLDPKGVRVAGGKAVKDRPAVACDGQDFLVVWEDIRSGADWDVYGARVSGEGKVLDADGALLAGGANNQCRPAVAFCKGNYLVAYMAYAAKAAPGDPCYITRCLRVSPAGRPLDAEGSAASDPAPKRHLWQTCAAAGDGGVLVAAYLRDYGPDYKAQYLGVGVVGADGRPAVQLRPLQAASPSAYGGLVLSARTLHQSPAAAWTGKGFLAAIPTAGATQGPGQAVKGKDAVAIFPLDAQGKSIDNGVEFAVLAPERLRGDPCVGLAFDGERCLLVEDVIVGRGRPRSKDEVLVPQVLGCFLSPAGKPLDGGKPFAVSDPASKARASQCSVATGPAGSFLALWSDARGIDDVKIAARVVK